MYSTPSNMMFVFQWYQWQCTEYCMAVVCWLLFDMLWGLVWPWAIICDLPHRPNSYIASSACAWLFLWHALGYTELSWSVVEPSAMALEAFGYGTWLFNLTNGTHQLRLQDLLVQVEFAILPAAKAIWTSSPVNA